VPENRRTQQDAGAYAGKPRANETAAEEGRCAEPARKQWQRIAGVARRGEVAMMRQLADRRERDDCDRAGESGAPQKNRRAPRKSLVRTGTMRTSLAEFGASIIRPSPMYIATCPTTGCS
jgi:hypothetical protein